MTKERRLGRGLEALLGRAAGSTAPSAPPQAPATAGAGAPPADGLLQVNVYEIDNNPFQPRRDFDEAEIDELADSLQQHGMIQPLVVRRHGDRYQLIAGERRLRAAIKAGWQQVPVQVREADDRQMAELAIVENLQRKDLNALEKAPSFQQYLRALRLHPGRAGRPAEDRPLDDRQPDPPARAARADSAGDPLRHDHARARPGAAAAGRRARADRLLPADSGKRA